MWQDMKTYWAWRSKEPCPKNSPTVKRLDYVEVVYPSGTMNICCGVWDDEKYTPLHTEEIEWHKNNGAKVYGKV